MSDKFFLDTNIFLYLFDPNAPHKAEVAENIIGRAIATGKGVISFQVVQEFFSGAFKRVSRPMTEAEGQRYLNETLAPLLAVHSSAALYSEALSLYAAGGLSWYDSLIVAAALQAKCDLLYSEDMQHGRRFGSLRIVNPFL
jgi:predicted nucleic acid-binding protein